MIPNVRKIFHDRFQTRPIVISSPGRVNLIGEHTDYNEGFVLPAAIDKCIWLAMARNDLRKIRLHSIDMDPEYFETDVAGTYEKTDVPWANYLIGVVDELAKSGHPIEGFDCVFGGDIPIGAGLSSSAALETGTAYGLSQLFGLGLTRMDMTKIAMRAENHFVGVQCGIMDQFASLHGEENSVLKLDCRSLEYRKYPFDRNDIRILLCDTKVRRELAASEYNIRRSQCEEGVGVIREQDPAVKNLRDITPEQLETNRHIMDPVVYRRCRYVLQENERVQQCCEDLLKHDFSTFGHRMYQSHQGLRDEYEVSCPELDIFVEAAGTMDSILGARMMGGGFGGCTINLVLADKIDQTISKLDQFYQKHTGITPDFHVATIGNGTHVISGPSMD